MKLMINEYVNKMLTIMTDKNKSLMLFKVAELRVSFLPDIHFFQYYVMTACQLVFRKRINGFQMHFSGQ